MHTKHALSPSIQVPAPSPDLLRKLVFVQTLLRVRRTPKIAGRRTLALFTDARLRSVREGGPRRPALLCSPLPPQPFPASGRASASVSLFLIFSPFPLPFLFFFPLPPLSPFPLGGASLGQGQSRPHPAPLPGPRRPMARGRPLLTGVPAAAVGGAGPAAAASGPGSSWN